VRDEEKEREIAAIGRGGRALAEATPIFSLSLTSLLLALAERVGM
jgi:hypothetical protein